MSRASPEVMRRASRRYRERHPEKVAAYVLSHREQHRAHAQAKYDAALASGKCIRCDNPHRDGFVLCVKCWQSQLACNRKTKYGVVASEVSHLLEAQDGRCAICSVVIGVNAHVDHDHETREVRGLLCGSCNRGLGMFRDSPEALEKAATYLRNWRKS